MRYKGARRPAYLGTAGSSVTGTSRSCSFFTSSYLENRRVNSSTVNILSEIS